MDPTLQRNLEWFLRVLHILELEPQYHAVRLAGHILELDQLLDMVDLQQFLVIVELEEVVVEEDKYSGVVHIRSMVRLVQVHRVEVDHILGLELGVDRILEQALAEDMAQKFYGLVHHIV